MSPDRLRLLVLAAAAFAAFLPAGSFAATLADQPPVLQSTTSGLVLKAHAQALSPAPLPDPDVSPPASSNAAPSAQADPSLEPSFFNPQNHFAGDGYAPGSTIEYNHNNRHTPGGGMSLSIPMQ